MLLTYSLTAYSLPTLISFYSLSTWAVTKSDENKNCAPALPAFSILSTCFFPPHGVGGSAFGMTTLEPLNP